MDEEAIPQTVGAKQLWFKRTVPLIVSAGIIYYYFHEQNWDELLIAVRSAHLPFALLSVFVPQLVFWFFETLITERHIRWFHGDFSFRNYFWVRGGLYILMFLNNVIGAGGIILYLKRKTAMSWKKLWGIMLFRFGLTMWGINIVMVPATIGVHHFGLADKVELNMFLWWALLIGGLIWFVQAWGWWHYGSFPRVSRLIVKDRESEFWTAFRLADRQKWLLTWAMVLPPFYLMLIGVWFLAWSFGIHIPFVEYLVLSPIFFFIMDLPIAFAGFGTATLAWNMFFSDYGDSQAVCALTLFLPFARATCRLLIGFISLRPALRDVTSLLNSNEKIS